MRRAVWAWVLCGAAAWVGAGCGDDGSGGGRPATPGTSNNEGHGAALTWHRDIKPIVDAHCNTCHSAGGLAPFPLETLAQVKAASALIPGSIVSRRMPPFLAAPAKRPLRFDTSLSEAQVAAVVAWIEDGLPEGDPSAPGAPIELPKSALSRTDVTLEMAEPYAPTTAPDEYRCFVLPWPGEAATSITGYEIVPGNPAIDHHAAIFVIGVAEAPLVDAADGADGKGAGYPCFGSAAPPGHEGIPNKLLAAWTPGGGGVDFPEGTGVRIAPGERVVLQMHYSVLEPGAESDQTAIRLSVQDDVPKSAGNLPWLDIAWPSDPETMRIPAGAPMVAFEHAADPTRSPLFGSFVPGVDPSEGLVIHGLLPHMHRLGEVFWLQVERADGTVERVFEINDWDFDWQSYYFFEEPLTVMPGDRLRMRCEFNNSQAKQPVVDGQRGAPRDVRWGEGTSDEMCTASMYVNGIAEPDASCPGSVAAAEGRFEVTFDAEPNLRQSSSLDGEFVGPVQGSIYRAEDVTLTGPLEGTEPVATFAFAQIDLREGPDGPHLIDAVLPAGEYQFLGYMDTDGNAEEEGGPDLNDPLMIPVRAVTMGCEVQRVTVLFPLLLPRR